MANIKSPFHQIGVTFKDQPILPFLENTILAKKYLKKIQGKDITKLFIGWICDRDSFFAYLYKFMKKEARDSGSTKLASKIACAGFSILLPEINNWILENALLILIIPVPSRYGVSERFATKLYEMLNKDSKKVSKIKKIFNRSDNFMEIKKIDSWKKRKQAVENLFSLRTGLDLNKYSVLLVDDIVTSGSSLRKCANILKQCGVQNIAAVSLATNLFDRYSYKTKYK
ncbi:MAG TPA: hypothetical protein ENI56_02515 [Candidatus Kaiserbacteria bacterium]|nr:hypothetical protein [Candidatus Kaiserbacteria bacterium]